MNLFTSKSPARRSKGFARSHSDWTPELQVKALKRFGQSILVLTLGFAIQGMSQWFASSIAIVSVGYLGLLIAVVVAPILAATSGVLGRNDAYSSPTFSDEFCQATIHRAYKVVCWALIAISAALLLLPSSMLPQWVVEGVSLSRIGTAYLLIAALSWSWVVLSMLRDDKDEAE